jgi:hypothetical protein
VRVPFAGRLAELVPCATVRIRRDFDKLLGLICACALLHQRQRGRDADGAVVASLDDYAAVREVLEESFASTQQDGLTAAQREAVQAVQTLGAHRAPHPDPAQEGVTLSAVARHLRLDKSAAKRRLANPLKQGYVVNLEVRRGAQHQARYVLGEPLPEAATVLPDPALLQGAGDLRELEVG